MTYKMTTTAGRFGVAVGTADREVFARLFDGVMPRDRQPIEAEVRRRAARRGVAVDVVHVGFYSNDGPYPADPSDREEF